jgi:2-polyprenyl-6-hydroxyphenyl methylase/3-demethylubiquinone-9 3-methyltransferase
MSRPAAIQTGDSTIDPREVEFYTQLAETWWDRDGPFWPLHKLNALRLVYIRDHLCRHFGRDAESSRPLRGVTVLDVGCGGGILSESMALLGADVTGIDIVEKNIHVARLHAQEHDLSIDYRLMTAAELANAGARFDVVLNMEVVEHVADLEAFMRDCNRLTAVGGATFVATINRTPLGWLFAIVGAEYILRWLPRGTHRWSLFRKPDEIAALLADGDLDVEDITGVAANPFTRTLRRTGLTNVNYMMFCTRRREG